jgi:hypothetical protein
MPTLADRAFVYTERLGVFLKPLGVLTGLLARISRLRKATDKLVLVPLMQVFKKRQPLQGKKHFPAVAYITVYSESELHRIPSLAIFQ